MHSNFMNIFGGVRVCVHTSESLWQVTTFTFVLLLSNFLKINFTRWLEKMLLNTCAFPDIKIFYICICNQVE